MPQRGARAAVLKERLIQIVGVFGEIRLPYMVIGAFALAAWGRPRATLDLDFMIQTLVAMPLPGFLLRRPPGS